MASKKAVWLSGVGWVIVGLVIAVIGFEFFADVHAERRFAIYSIARQLRPGMRREEVEEILGEQSAPFLVRQQQGNRLYVRVSLGAVRTCTLTMEFDEATLRRARIRGENGPEDRCADAPSDIGQ